MTLFFQYVLNVVHIVVLSRNFQQQLQWILPPLHVFPMVDPRWTFDDHVYKIVGTAIKSKNNQIT